jgi:beta-lactamase class A
MARASALLLLIATQLAPQSAHADGGLKPSAELVRGPWADALDREVANIRRSFKGHLAVYVSDPYRGFRWGFNENEPVYLASGVKVAFMIEVYRQRDQGKLRFDEKITFGPDQIRDGAPRVNSFPQGHQFTIQTLLELMMQHSDNAASDMLANRVGLERINAGLKEEGLSGVTPLTYLIDVRKGIFTELDPAAAAFTPAEIRTLRWTPVWEPQIKKFTEMVKKPKGTYTKQHLLDAYERYYAKNINRAPMATMGLLLEKLVRGELISSKTSAEMFELMSHAKTSTHRILGRLPPGTKVAHKTGSQFERVCDLGVITLPDKYPLIVTACTADGTVPAMEGAIARIARAAYDQAVAEHKKAKKEAALPRD